jgi:hypothetical protein
MQHLQMIVLGLVVWNVACSSGGSPRPPESGLDETVGGPSRDAAHTLTHLDGSPTGFADGAVDARPDTGQPSRDASGSTHHATSTLAPNSFHRDASAAEQSSDAAVLIIDPEIGLVDLEVLCADVGQLQGRVIDTDLLGHVVLGAWAASSTTETNDGGVDAGMAQGTTARNPDACIAAFAPYVIECQRGPIVLQSPAFVYGEGPLWGGERVSIGCLEQGCSNTCLPASSVNVSRVRGRLNPVIPANAADGSVVSTGLVRVNGVNVEAIATFDVIARL